MQYCSILEVLKDETPSLGPEKTKFGAREQRWTALEVAKDGLSLVSAFQDRGTMKGLGWATGDGEKKLGGTEMGVGSVAKIYGFGGRRV